MPANQTHTTQITHVLHVAAPGGQGARALLRLLMDAGRHLGLTPLSFRSCTDPQRVRPAHQAESGTICFSARGGRPVRVTAVLQPNLMHLAAEGILLVNSREPICSETVCSVDADGIARDLGIPAYLPMIGAIARLAGWTDLERIKAFVRLALEDTAPYWIGAGLDGVESGFRSVSVQAAA